MKARAIEGHRQLAERADVAGKLDVPVGEQLPAIVIPYVFGHDVGHPIPAQLLLYRHVSAEDVQRFPQNRQSCRISPGVVRHQAIQKKIGCARSGCRRRCGLDVAGHFQHTAAESQATGKHSGAQCLQVGRPG